MLYSHLCFLKKEKVVERKELNRSAILVTAIAVAALAVSSPALGDDGFIAVATSSVFRVETSNAGAMTAGSAAKVAFAPRYQVSDAADGSYVVLKMVNRPDTEYATTSVVYTCAADQEGTYELNSDSLQGGYVRLLHELYNSDGKVEGKALVGDVAFAVAEASSNIETVDSRSDAFQLAAESGADLTFAYDSSWCTNGTAAYVKLSRVQDRFRKGRLCTSVTSEVFEVASPAVGDCYVPASFSGGGTFTYMLNFFSESGDQIGDGIIARCRFDEIWGMQIILK